MKSLLVSVLGCVLLAGCQSALTEEEIRNATLYFPPRVKYLEKPRFGFSSAERKHALLEYRDHGADTLFELIIDNRGKVKRARLVQTNARKEYHSFMESHAHSFSFSEDPGTELYRTFYFPMDYDVQAEFEWLDGP